MKQDINVIAFESSPSWSGFLTDVTLLQKGNQPGFVGSLKRNINNVFNQDKFDRAYLEAWQKYPSSHPLNPYINSMSSMYFDGSLEVASLLSSATLMFGVGAIYRVLNLATISAQNHIYSKNWRWSTRALAATAISLTSFYIMDALGYEAVELLIAEIVRICAAYLMPYVFGNFFRGMDIISPTTTFNPIDYLGRNAMYSLRNFASTIFIDYGLPYITLNAPLRQIIWDTQALLRRDKAGIYLDTSTLPPSAHLVSNKHAFFPKLVLDEASFTLGKIFVDMTILLMAKFGFISDIRDPFKALFSKPVQSSKNTGGLPPRILLKILEEQRKQEATSAQIINKEKIAQKSFKRQTSSSSSTNNFWPISQGSSEGAALPRKQKSQNLESKSTKQDADVAIHEVRNMFSNSVNPKHKIVPLCGTALQGNIWGVITALDCGNEFKAFESALEHGIINQSGKIKYLDKGGKSGEPVFEIKCNQDARLLGRYFQGEREVYSALSNVFGIDETQRIIDVARKDGNELGFICFNNYVAKHNEIRPTLMRM
jgi:hypothetical protein